MGAPCVLPPNAVQNGSSSTICSPDVSNLGSSSSLPVQSCSLSVRPRHRLGLRADSSEDFGSSSAAKHVKSIRRPVLRRAQNTQQESTSAPSMQPVSLEDENVAVEGVIKVDKERAARPSWGRASTLAGGDLVALIAFASIGRISHGMPVLSWETIRTADPFVAGWLLGAYFLGGFGPEGQGLYGLRAAVASAAKSWAVSIPIGLAIRTFITGHTPPEAFILVSLGSTFVLLISWRAGFTALFPNEDTSRDAVSKKGSIFEFFELLTSLVKRW